MKTLSRLFAGAALLLATFSPAQAIDTDPGYGPWAQSQRSNGSRLPAGPYYRPTKRYVTKNGTVLYGFVAVSPRVAWRGAALGNEAWVLSKSQQWSIDRGMSPRIVVTNAPAYAPKPAPIAEAPQAPR